MFACLFFIWFLLYWYLAPLRVFFDYNSNFLNKFYQFFSLYTGNVLIALILLLISLLRFMSDLGYGFYTFY